jgi:hypothetical protein
MEIGSSFMGEFGSIALAIDNEATQTRDLA